MQINSNKAQREMMSRLHLHCYVSVQVSGDVPLEEDDEVSFEAGVHVATGARKAVSVQLLTKANDSTVRTELGQVIECR